MPKGQPRSNREHKKPKQPIPPAPLGGSKSAAPGDTTKRK